MIRAISFRNAINQTWLIKFDNPSRFRFLVFELNSERFITTSALNHSNDTNQKTKKYNRPPPIDLKSVRTNQSDKNEDSGQHKKSSKTGALFLLTIPAITFALGVWQVKRRDWKLKLIDFLDARTKSEPIDFPSMPEKLENFIAENEYKPFRLRGHFLHSREVIITMRHDLSGRTHVPGGHVITPFVLSTNPNVMVLVNRGFVPYTHFSPMSRHEAQIESEIEIIGLLRTNEPANTFTPLNVPPNEWHFRDVEQLANVLGTKPLFFDAVSTVGLSEDKIPYPGQTAIQLRNDHLIYLFTWFSLSFITSILWWKRFSKLFI